MNTSGTSGGFTAGNASNLNSGTVATARLGSGTASSSTYLRGDNSWATVTSVGGATGVDFNDNVKARFGTGNDLEIYHSGSIGVINNGANGTAGHLVIRGDDIYLQGSNTSEELAHFVENGAVELYYDNSKKLETTSTGITVTGDIRPTGHIYLGDADVLALGASEDLQIYHDGSNSYIKESSGSSTGDLRIQANNLKLANWDGGGTYLYGANSGSVDLYYDNSKKFETRSDGTKTTGVSYLTEGTIYLEKGGAHHHRILINDQGNDLAFQQSSDTGANTNFTSYLRMKDGGDIWLPVDNKKLIFGAGSDLEIYSGGTIPIIKSNNDDLRIQAPRFNVLNVAGTEHIIDASQNSSVALYYDNSKKFETTSAGATVTGSLNVTDDFTLSGANANLTWDKSADTLEFMDNGKAAFGNSDDLQIYHSGSHSYIDDSGTGDLYIRGSSNVRITDLSDNKMILCQDGGETQLYYDGIQKFATKSFGFEVSSNSDRTANFDTSASNGAYIGFKQGGSSHNYVGCAGGLGAGDKDDLGLRGGDRIIFLQDSTARAYFDSNGHFKPWGNNTYDLGDSSDRWRNLYTNDLNLSNEGSANEVDGTWGDYTIQEGESDLFLLNRRNGKKYKFNVTEVN
jgi:hypothetical protein